MRLAVIRQHYGELHYLRNLFDELDKIGRVTTFVPKVPEDVPEGLAGFGSLDLCGINPDEFEAVLWFPTYQRMSVLPDFDWGSFAGHKILLDFDVCQNYSSISSNDRLDTYAAEIKRHQIDTIIVSGRQIRDSLRAEGINALWMPSATDPSFFKDNVCTEPRAVHFGTRYPARRKMMRILKHSGLQLEHLSCARSELPDLLSQVSIGVICDMQAAPLVPLPRSLFRKLPSGMYRVFQGIEPMMKQYEYASAGVMLVCDRQPDREFLGFVDFETCFHYDGIKDAARVLQFALTSQDPGDHVTEAAMEMTLKWHTWARRAPALLSACASGGLPYLDTDYQPQ